MLEISGLCAGYDGAQILHGISLTARSGSVTAVIGPNGCGKSTLLKTIAGILTPDAGRIRLDGLELQHLSPPDLAQKIAYLAQSRQVPQITAERLVLHGRFPYLSYPRRYRREDHEIVRRVMESMGIADLGQRMLDTLSGGQRQKVYIAMALAQDTPVILMDEPTTFLDVAHQMRTMQEARALARAGKTVILVIHDIAMALKYADRLAVMRGGKILACADAESIFAGGSLERAFGIRVERVQTPDGWQYYYGEGK